MRGEIIRTDRLILRSWMEEDLEPFIKLNADPRVMEYFVSTRTPEETRQSVKLYSEGIEKRGWGLWAVSLIETGAFIGFIGIDDQFVPFPPAVEIGWRLAFEYWGKGYATEGAKASLQYGFETVKLNEILAFTAVQNKRSRAVMDKIGMIYYPEEDFDHPKAPVGHPLSRTVVYRITKDEWMA